MLNILKFGGTSMNDEHTWRKVFDIISRYKHPVVIVSATARTTRQLMNAANTAVDDLANAAAIAESIGKRHRSLVNNFLAKAKNKRTHSVDEDCEEWIESRITNLKKLLEEISLQKNVSASQKDAIASTGEQLSAYLFARCGAAYGLDTCWLDARNIIKTDANFGAANPELQQIERTSSLLKNESEKGRIPIIGGFYGENARGEITTLGFEGSDYSASLAGAALEAQTIEIWTDVSGIYTCDPRVVEKACPIAELSFDEATQLAHAGAKVLHPSTMKPAASAAIPLLVKNIFAPQQPGTKIHKTQPNEDGSAKAMAYLEDLTVITVTAEQSSGIEYNFRSQVLDIFRQTNIDVKTLTESSANTISAIVQSIGNVFQLEKALQKLGKVKRREKQALISIIGCSLQGKKRIEEIMLKKNNSPEPAIIFYEEAKNTARIAVPESSLGGAVNNIHHLFFE